MAHTSTAMTGGPALYHAACFGNTETVIKLIISGCKGDQPNENDEPWSRHPIHIAAYHGHLNTVISLVDFAQVDINSQDQEGQTPLYWATVSGRIHIIQWLIKSGAELNSVFAQGISLMHVSTWLGSEDVCRLLCEAGISVNSVDEDGMTPLHDAVSQGKLDLLQLFLDYGGDVNLQTFHGNSALHMAVIRSHAVQDSNSDEIDKQTDKLLVEKLLQAGASIEMKDKRRRTPLFLAVLVKKVEICKILLDWGADVNAYDVNGDSMFATSLFTGRHDVVSMLLDAGCCIHKERWIQAKMWPYPLLCAVDLCDRVTQIWLDAWHLSQLCRCAIRHLLKSNKRIKARSLPLPRVLQDFVGS